MQMGRPYMMVPPLSPTLKCPDFERPPLPLWWSLICMTPNINMSYSFPFPSRSFSPHS